MYNKKKWMKQKDLEEEKEVLAILSDKKLTKIEKAKKIGFKKTTILVDGIKKSGYINENMSFYKTLKSLIQSRTKLPLGFDFYFWGYEYYKMNKKENNNE